VILKPSLRSVVLLLLSNLIVEVAEFSFSNFNLNVLLIDLFVSILTEYKLNHQIRTGSADILNNTPLVSVYVTLS
jgi:hypothetical protein